MRHEAVNEDMDVKREKLHAPESLLLLLVLGLFGLVACPFGRKAVDDVTVSPSVIDMGTSQVETTVNITPVSARVARSAFTVETAEPWIDVSPKFGTLAESGVPVPIAVTVVRAKMHASGDQGAVSIAVSGETVRTVAVRAEAILAADFQVSDTDALEDHPIAFSDRSSVITGSAPIERWNWDFGDGTTSTERNPVHAYAARGRYTVKLTVASADLHDTRTRRGYIRIRQPQGPTAEFAASRQRPLAGVPVQFSDITEPGTSPIATWLWDFGDGGWSKLQDPVHLYTAATVYDVYLTVTTAEGSDTEIKLGCVDVQPAPPDAEFVAAKRNCSVGQPIAFSDLSTGKGVPITQWKWDFGDGTTSAERDPLHPYTTAGTYTVALTVRSGAGTDFERKRGYISVRAAPR